MEFFIFFQILKEHSVCANNGESDQMLHFATSHLGLHCSPMSHKKDARLIWVNNMFITYGN